VCLAVIAGAPLLAQTLGPASVPPAAPHGAYTPPPCVPGVPFSDIQCTGLFDAWIEQFVRDGITAGCGGGRYCPDDTVTRGQMSVFIEKAMRGTMNWPPHTVLVHHRPYGETDSDLNSGTDLLTMVASIPNTGPEMPANGRPWVIKLGPGQYNLGSSTLVLPQWVSIEGSGMNETVIFAATASGPGSPGVALVAGGLNTLTRLLIINFGSGTASYGIQANSFLTLDQVGASSQGSATYLVGVYVNNGRAALVNGSIAYCALAGPGREAYGIYINSASGSANVYNSWASGETNAIYDSGGTVYMAYSGVQGGPLAKSSGTFLCIGNFDDTLSPVICP